MLRKVEEIAYCNRFSTIHPAEKLLFGLGMLLIALASPPLPGALVILVIITAAVGAAGVPRALYLKALGVPFLFTVTGVLGLVIRLDWQQGLQLDLSAGTALQVVSLASRSLAAIGCLSFLALTTPVAHLLALLKGEGSAGVVRDIMLTLYSTLFLFVEAVERMYRAQQARLGYEGWSRSLRSAGNMASALWVGVTVKSHRLYLGLSSRGYPEGVHSAIDFQPLSWTRIGWISGAFVLAITVSLGVRL